MVGRIASHSRSGDEAGVSLVEIVIAMFILALMSVSVLPLLVGGVQMSAVNRGAVAADSLAEAQLAAIQAEFRNSAANSCAAVAARAASGVSDPSGSGASAAIEIGTCPATYPGVVSVKIVGYRAGSTTPAVTLNSAILVAKP